MRYEDARRAPDAVTRLKAHALAVAVEMARAPFAAFFAITRRLEVDDVVVHEARAGTRTGAGVARAWVSAVARLEPLDPFAPRRVADTGAAVVLLGDLDGGLDAEPYRGRLREAGVGDVACLYLRSAGALVAGIGLLRERGEPGFAAREVAMLRRLHPLLEHAYAFARRPHPEADPARTVVAALTPREAEVAHLVAIGATNAEIAHALSVSLATVKTHLTQIYAKLGLRSRTQLAVLLRPDRS